MVFKGRADQPGALGRFDQDSTSRRDRLGVASVQVVVRGPAPHVFDVGGGGAGEMDQAPCGFALVRGATAVCLDLAARSAADAEVGVPETDVAG